MRYEIEDNLLNSSCTLKDTESGRIVSKITGDIEFVNDYEVKVTDVILKFSYSHVPHWFFTRWIFLANKRYTVNAIKNILTASASMVFI